MRPAAVVGAEVGVDPVGLIDYADTIFTKVRRVGASRHAGALRAPYGPRDTALRRWGAVG